MDKRKVIEAYRRGFLTLQECSQILGLEKTQLTDLLLTQNGVKSTSMSSGHSPLQATYER